MVGYLNEESLQLTRTTGRVHFWSRSRSELWEKGATSGNYLHLVDIASDCDGDALLIQVRPAGPTCHTGKASCFDATFKTAGFTRLEAKGGLVHPIEHFHALVDLSLHFPDA